METFKTTDICDEFGDDVQVAEPLFTSFGALRAFGGRIATVKVHEDNVLVRAALEEPGEGRVLIVDGGGSLRCALLGDLIAGLAERNGWAGVVIFGCVRDTGALASMDLGILALAVNPRRSDKQGAGRRDVGVSFAGVRFIPGAYAYADEDGLVVIDRDLGKTSSG